MRQLHLGMALVVLLAITACTIKMTEAGTTVTTSPKLDLPAGAKCTVHFRRDAIGVAADSPIHIGFSDIAIAGKFVKADEDWIVVDTGKMIEWIPRSTVLHIGVAK